MTIQTLLEALDLAHQQQLRAANQSRQALAYQAHAADGLLAAINLLREMANSARKEKVAERKKHA